MTITKIYKLFSKGDTIYLVYTGATRLKVENLKQTEMIRDDFLQIINQNPQKVYNGLIDILQTEHNNYFPYETRKVFVELSHNKQLNKIAVVGSSIFWKTIINTFIKIVRMQKRYKWFNDQKEAEKWLRK